MTIGLLRTQPVGLSRFLGAGYGVVAISLLSVFTVGAGGSVLFGLPQVFVVSLIFSGFMLLALRFRVEQPPLQFAFIYLLSIMPGTVYAAIDGGLEGRSFVQLLASLGTFVIVSSFLTRWQNANSEEAKGRALEVAILAFLAFGVFEILFYEFVLDLRSYLHGADAIPEHLFRDTLLYYAPRPTGMFSEVSNFARFTGILVAAYLIVTRRIARTFIYIGAFVLLTRSPSFWFAAPALVLGLMAANPQRAIAGFWSTFSKGLTGPLIVVGIIIFGGLIVFSQGERIEVIQSGNESSFNERLADPALFLLRDWGSPILGSGATAHNEMAGIGGSATRRLKQVEGAIIKTDVYRQAIAPTLLIIASMGAIGLSILFFGEGICHGIRGIIWIGAFFLANFVSAGFNSAMMWVPCALLFSLCWTVLSRRRGEDFGFG